MSPSAPAVPDPLPLVAPAPLADLLEAAQALRDGRLEPAERLCRAHLARDPRQVDALRMLAEIAALTGALEPALALLDSCLQLAPDYRRAHLQRAEVLTRLEWYPEALAEVEVLERLQPGNASQAVVRAAALLRLGRYEPAAAAYRALAQAWPQDAALRNGQGHAHKALGQTARAVQAYQDAIAANPDSGEAYWNLANLKSYRFTDGQLEQLQQALAQGNANALSPQEAVYRHFALASALEARGAIEESFAHYERGNTLAATLHPHDSNALSREIDGLIAAFPPERCADLRQGGSPAPDPLFIVGLPRSGSTLVEHILGAHSQVDATKELPFLPALVHKVSAAAGCRSLAGVDVERLDRKALAQAYLARAAPLRRGAPYFTDKLPNNFLHVGFIKALFPKASIIDVRRDPMASCFSCYKQLFASGNAFSYQLEHLGRYYRDYLRLMDHWNRCYLGEIHTVHYEALVEKPDEEIAQLLERCGLALEESCRHFHTSTRPVATPSAEQVRQPIYRSGNSAWSAYQNHLAPLVEALGYATAGA